VLPAIKLPKTNALDCTATGIGVFDIMDTVLYQRFNVQNNICIKIPPSSKNVQVLGLTLLTA
jgi:hypothetical protein